ncbi:MAG TPA: ribosome biogenesis GTPase YlqF [Clostridiales bacterium]|nr:ribosome biogenesis GTPase YlqF [Clostridiales bacterium]
MRIHWFPGHMTKAFRLIEREMKLVSSVIYVLDARAPLSCINPEFDKLINTKPTLYILNKADLVAQSDILEWIDYFNRKSIKCLQTVSVQRGASRKQIFDALKEINADYLKKFDQKGVRKTIRAMVIGVPNSGKSALINSLLGRKKTVTGNKPGVTRGKQWIAVDKYIELMDTPGTLYPDFKDQTKARNLAIIGSISDDVVDMTELAGELIDFLKKEYPQNLKERYKLDDLSVDTAGILYEIGQKRGFIVKGGEVDIQQTAKAVIVDFRKNALGKIIMEKANELIEV